jgi:hypothetical protein
MRVCSPALYSYLQNLRLQNYFETKLRNTPNIPTYANKSTLHLLHPFGRYVYGHYFDTFQKLQIVSKEKLQYDSVLLSLGHEIKDFSLHLQSFGLNSVDKISNNGGLAKINSLTFIRPVAHPTP